MHSIRITDICPLITYYAIGKGYVKDIVEVDRRSVKGNALSFQFYSPNDTIIAVLIVPRDDSYIERAEANCR